MRDLAWAIGSPPVMELGQAPEAWPDSAWFSQKVAAFASGLSRLDTDTQPGDAGCSEVFRRQRLGVYFESLISEWLERDPAFELLARNFAVRRRRRGGGKETLGELDFVVRNLADQRVEHWEVAVKFYLGRLPLQHGGPSSEWVGPGLRDRLDLKVDRLVDHQIPLAHRAETRELLAARGIRIDASRVLLKGRLFYPIGVELGPPDGAGADHLRGWWMRIGEFPGPLGQQGWSWRRLKRREWLAPVAPRAGEQETLMPADAFAVARDIGEARWPRMVVALADGHEVTRGFLVPDAWAAGEGPVPAVS